jgi:glycosyltransferase involved in cell wall biosynthesis
MERILVTIPVHNEEHMLAKSVLRLSESLFANGVDFRLSIAEDGSTDRTLEVIEELERKVPGLIVQSIRHKVGRGRALRMLWSKHDAFDIYAFVDADLATTPESLLKVIEICSSGVDVVTGSRYVHGATVRRPPGRRFASEMYNALVRKMFNEQVQDHQCGLKAFRRAALLKLLPLSQEDSWAWDTEVMVLATRVGLTIREVPVDWTENRGKRTPWLRLVSDVRLHASALLRLKGELDARIAGSLSLPSGAPTAKQMASSSARVISDR